jgi:hypothetical protein
MGKILNTYRGYANTDLRTRSSIPTQGDISLGTGNIDCSNISLSAVKNVLSASTYSLYDICRHANVNQWSAESPKIKTYTSSGSESAVLTITNPTVAKLGDFAGYNHYAVTPGWIRTDNDIWVNQGNAPTITGSIQIGELRYDNAQSVVVVAYDGASYAGSQFIPLDQYVKDQVDFTVSASTISSQTTFTLKAFMSQDTSNYSSGTGNLCRVPNCSNVSCTVNIRTGSSGSSAGMSPFSVSGFYWDAATGVIGFSDAVDNSNSYSSLEVYAYLSTDGYGSFSPINLYSGSYTASQSLGALEADFGVSGGAYGYHFTLVVEASA